MNNNGIKEAFFSVLQTNPSHAYLLLGEHEQSREVAMNAAEILLCESEKDVPCGHCDSCRWYQAKSHPDFVHIFPDYSLANPVIRIAQVRNLQEEINRRAQKKTKVIWIEDANMMNKQAQNACLKMLEEPPDNVVFLLTGQEAGFLPTIRSRCNVVRLGSKQENTNENISQENFQKASVILVALMKKNILQVQSLLMADKKIFADILQALILLLRECIANQLMLNSTSIGANEIISELTVKKILTNKQENLKFYNKLLFDCFEQQKHLHSNASITLCIDVLCINMNEVMKKHSF